MFRNLVADTLVGIICLALIGVVSFIAGPTVTFLLAAAAAIGFIVRPVLERRHRDMEDARLLAVQRANRARLGIPDLAFPNRPIVPRRDAHFGP